ncbi:MAG: PD40 domain-containing protein [Verrucomicrobia bacterium]|nr:PD40 domain-containing protein [Verrucomicrobiota bacterium]
MAESITLRVLALLLVVLAVPALAADEAGELPPRLLYHPSISKGIIAFSCFGDIWTVREDGSALKRITDHPGRDVHPVLSPDGSLVAFASDRTGPTNVFVVPATGGEARQLTWSSTTQEPVTWTPDGKRIVFRGEPNGTWGSWLYTIAVESGQAELLRIGEAGFGTFSADGKQFAFNRRQIGDSWRKGYLGSGNSDVWVADLEAGTFEKRTDFAGPDSWPLFAPNGDIYFVSERNGPKNLFRLRRGRGDAQQVTHHDGPGVVYPAISPDGRTIVYQCNFAIWAVSTRDGTARQVPVTMAAEPKRELSTWVTYDSRCDEFAVRPDGKRLAVSCRGALFTVPTEKGGDRVRVSAEPGRDHVPVFSPDGTKLAFISDRSGEEHIYVQDLATGAVTEIVPPESLLAVELWTWLSDRTAFRPDGKALTYQAGHGLYLYDFESGETARITDSPDRSIGRSAWSPDGRWLAYAKNDHDCEEHLWVYSLETKEERQLYNDTYGEWNPVFSPDGKYLLFLAKRETGKDDGCDTIEPEIYALALQREQADPDEPKDPDAEQEVEEGEGEEKEAAGAEEEAEPLRVEIDFDNVDQRTRRITHMVEGIRSPLYVTGDSKRVVFGVEETRGRERVGIVYTARIEWAKESDEDLKEIGRLEFWKLQLAEEGKTIYVLDGGQVRKVPVDGGEVKTVQFSLRFAVDLRAEMRQMYLEAWRALRDGFYDETMHGVDWAGARARYEPFLGSVVAKQEVLDLIIEMIGELNASHCGAWQGGSDQTWTYEDARRLGLRLEPDDASGRYRVSHIYTDGPADKSWLDLKVGDYVFSIEGSDVRAGEDHERLLINPLNDKVTLRVGREADPATAHDVRIAHIRFGEQRQLWYDEWVRQNERTVEAQSDGRVGYLHIRRMDTPSLAKFKKDLQRVRHCEGLIIDVRHNGGGLIDEPLLDILNRRAYNHTRYRGASRKRPRPEEAFYGTKVVLMNAFSFSDAEIFPDGFRRLGHGKLVGEPTHGGVIGTGAFTLIDGSTVRMPVWGFWTPDGQNLENYGVPPDVLVDRSPLDDLNGTDAQLDSAIREVLAGIEAKADQDE